MKGPRNMECNCEPGSTDVCHKVTETPRRNCSIAECNGYAQPKSSFCQGHIKLMMKEKETMNTDECFWIVWDPKGIYNPKCKHTSSVEAEREAERMARFHNGQEFFVMRAESVSCVASITRKLTEPCPF